MAAISLKPSPCKAKMLHAFFSNYIFIRPASLVGRCSQSFRHTISLSGLKKHLKAFKLSTSSDHSFWALWERKKLKHQQP